MRKVKLIVHEKYAVKQSPSDVFAAVFLSDTVALTLGESPGSGTGDGFSRPKR